jgi:dihydroflavonol-4-reductase
MKILVTGSTGFIGSQLCRALVEQGHRVLAFHRSSSSLRGLEGIPGCHEQPALSPVAGCLEHILGDLNQADTLAAALQGVEVVFHTAGLTNPGAQAARLYNVNVEGTRNLLQAAQAAGVRRVVHTSSVSALGVPLVGSLPVDENHAWNFAPQNWPYGYSKYLAEMEVQKTVATGLDVVIVNPSVVIGAGDFYNGPRSIVARAARRQIPFAVEGGLNVVHIADVVAGHIAAIQKGRRGERYLLCGQNLSHLEFIQAICAAASVPAPSVVLPAGLARALPGVLNLLQSVMDFPVPAGMLHLAGYHFYYNGEKARGELGLPEPRPAAGAIAEELAWLKEQQSASRPRASQPLKTVPMAEPVVEKKKRK